MCFYERSFHLNFVYFKMQKIPLRNFRVKRWVWYTGGVPNTGRVRLANIITSNYYCHNPYGMWHNQSNCYVLTEARSLKPEVCEISKF